MEKLRMLSRGHLATTVLARARSISDATTTDCMRVFDRQTKLSQRNLAARNPNASIYDYIRDEVGFRLADRVCDISRRFTVAVDWGSGRGHVIQNLTSENVDFLYQCDSSWNCLKRVATSDDVSSEQVNADEEVFPFRENSLDLVLSSMSLHWVNDLPGLFHQVLRCLKNDGCFLGVLPASDTLHELRVSLQLAELERLGGMWPHVSPFTDNVDVGRLLQQAGFNLITLDVEELTVHYPTMFHLIDDLQHMGESNAAFSRPLSISRDVLLAASTIYEERFGKLREDGESDEVCVPATVRLLYFIAWKPDPSQQKPLPRGSAKYSLKDISKIDKIAESFEQSNGNDTAPPVQRSP